METNNNTATETTTYHLPGTLDLLDLITLPADHDYLLTVDEGLAAIDAIMEEQAVQTTIDESVACGRCGGSGDIGRVTILGHSECLKCGGTGRLTHKGQNIGAAMRRAETQTHI